MPRNQCNTKSNLSSRVFHEESRNLFDIMNQVGDNNSIQGTESLRMKEEDSAVNIICSETSDDFSSNEVSEPPQRPLSAYNMFVRMERRRILQEPDDSCRSQEDLVYSPILFTHDEVSAFIESENQKRSQNIGAPKPPPRKHVKSHGKISFAELARLAASRWRSMSDEGRSIFRVLASQQFRLYKSKLATWNQHIASTDTSLNQTMNLCDSGEETSHRCKPQTERVRNFAKAMATSRSMDSPLYKRQKLLSPLVSPVTGSIRTISTIAEVFPAVVENPDDDVVIEQLMILAQQSPVGGSVSQSKYFDRAPPTYMNANTSFNLNTTRDGKSNCNELARCKAALDDLRHTVSDLQNQVKYQKMLIHSMQFHQINVPTSVVKKEYLSSDGTLQKESHQDSVLGASKGCDDRSFCRMIGPPDMETRNVFDTHRGIGLANGKYTKAPDDDKIGLDSNGKTWAGLTKPKLKASDNSSSLARFTKPSKNVESLHDKVGKKVGTIGHPLLHPSLKEHMMNSMNEQIRTFWEVENASTVARQPRLNKGLPSAKAILQAPPKLQPLPIIRSQSQCMVQTTQSSHDTHHHYGNL